LRRNLLHLRLGLLLCCILGTGRAVASCDRLPTGEPLWIRLTSPVSTYTAKSGDRIQAVLTQELVCEGHTVLPVGTAIDGIVRSKRKVGWGIRHETAALDLDFNRAVRGDGDPVFLHASVEEVVNAREVVHKGVIEGIRSSDTFQGRINSRLIHLPTFNPYSDVVLASYKAVFPIFPEPEIFYPAGTDLRLRTTAELSLPPDARLAPSNAMLRDVELLAEPDADTTQSVEDVPVRVTTTKSVDADIINIAFVGSESIVHDAFRHAGWQNADAVSHRTMLHNMYALLNNSGYAQQPMMTFLLNGRPQDMSWQKSLNSYGRRDHLRIWRWANKNSATAGDDATPVWVASSTHDTSAVLAVKYKGFVHHIAPDIDEERATVIRDLNFAGCVRSVHYVTRPHMPTATQNATGDTMRTDGMVAVVVLQPCNSLDTHPDVAAQSQSYRPGNHIFRFMRRQILTFRNDIFRANILYGAYDGGRMAFAALRHPPAPKTPSSIDVAATKPVIAAPADHTVGAALLRLSNAPAIPAIPLPSSTIDDGSGVSAPRN